MKTAIITGASGGIGKAVCEEFYKAGYLVGVCYNQTDGVEFAKEINAIPLKFDVSKFDETEKAVEEFSKKAGKIDVLVNVHGICLPIKTVLDVKDDEFDMCFSVNVKGVFNTTKCVIQKMIRTGGGSIVNLSSMWGITGASCEAVYSASKFAVIGLTKSLAKEYAESKIRVNAVAPGFIDTKMNNNIVGKDRVEAISEIPLKRIGTPEEVAKAVLFIAENEFITGEVLNINGGEII